MIRKLSALVLMVIGFIWIADVCLFGAQHHALWIWHSQNLTTGEMIPRADAVATMRRLELAIHGVYQSLVIPAGLILLGGILNGTRKKTSEPTIRGTQ